MKNKNKPDWRTGKYAKPFIAVMAENTCLAYLHKKGNIGWELTWSAMYLCQIDTTHKTLVLVIKHLETKLKYFVLWKVTKHALYNC